MNAAQDEENYSLIANSESDIPVNGSPKGFIYRYPLPLKVLFVTLTLLGVYLLLNESNFGLPSTACISPSTRREWRSLSRLEKIHYIDAVQCLRKRTSLLGLNQSLYDDFPYVHENIGNYSHGAAPFLAWHRYFLYIYEKALKEECQYDGHLTYWDWTLDWEDITQAPVWDNVLGFGGNGNPKSGKELNGGYCVTDGPFGGLDIPYFGTEYNPHCLSRGFASGENLTLMVQDIRPAAIEKLFLENDYEPFNVKLEITAHNSIPHIVRGDFLVFTAPFDPVFFLHHTQLDRIWWKWQQVKPRKRSKMYKGRAAHKSPYNAASSDLIQIGGIAPDIEVLEILSTVSGFLCYRY